LHWRKHSGVLHRGTEVHATIFERDATPQARSQGEKENEKRRVER
jgi:hypothetical protein